MRGKYWFDLDIPYKHFWIDNALGQLILISSPGVKQFAWRQALEFENNLNKNYEKLEFKPGPDDLTHIAKS